jgi:apolipoprotein D and lipocalin family protein
VDLSTVKEFVLERYLGWWHEIARYDHRFERGLTQVLAEYTQLADGVIGVVNTGFNSVKRRPSRILGKAKVTEVPGLLRVSFFWRFYSDYRVLALGDNYDWALVSAGRGDRFLWILARTEKLPQETLDLVLATARKRGFDTGKLIFD